MLKYEDEQFGTCCNRKQAKHCQCEGCGARVPDNDPVADAKWEVWLCGATGG